MNKRGGANFSPKSVLLGRQWYLSSILVIKRGGASFSPECVLLGRQWYLSNILVIKRGGASCVLFGRQWCFSIRLAIGTADLLPSAVQGMYRA